MVAENKKAQIKDIAARQTKGLSSLLNSGDQSESLINELTKALLGEIPFRKEMVSLDKLIYNVRYKTFLDQVISIHSVEWDENNELIKAVLADKIPDNFNQIWNFIFYKIDTAEDLSFFNKLLEQGYDEEYLLLKNCVYHRMGLIKITPNGYVISKFGEYFRDKIEDKKSFLGLKNEKGYYHTLIHAAFGGNHQNNNPNIGRGLSALLNSPNGRINHNLAFSLGIYFYLINPKLIEPYFEKFIMILGGGGCDIKSNYVEFLLSQNAEYYGPKIVAIASKYPLRNQSKLRLFSSLHGKTSVDYSNEMRQCGHEYLNRFYANKQNYFFDTRMNRIPMSIIIFDFFYQQSSEEFVTIFSEHLHKTNYITKEQVSFIDEKFGQKGVDLLIPIFQEKRFYINEKSVPFIFDFLNKYNYDPHKKVILEYLVNFASKKEQEIITQKINGLANIESDGRELLKGKKVGERIVGALILSNLKEEDKTTEIINILNEAIDTERNDATRNIMLESVLENRFSTPFDIDRAKAMIQKADKRKKLSKWSEKWLEENSVAKLYWKNGEEVGPEGLKFLLYRMKQTSGLQSEIEAKQLIRNLDVDKSEKLALQLLQAFIDSNSNAKLKYYLTLCGLLGSDNVLNKLHNLFKKSITDKRLKMAEYVLGSIAMIGSDKALRILEVISRKYANKKPKLSAVALASLDVAAEELGITKDQLADRIIPDFGFDGIFKEFEVEGETYRAFINKEFRLIYYNEDNKMRKSFPKGIDANQKKEFSEIAKEIRNIVKSQSDRLEKYMVESRTWESQDWQTFFFNNPIMFVYAMQLLWLRKNSEGEILDVFYCDEDAAMYNFEDEEVMLEDSDTISILHPLNLTEETLQLWKEKAFENNIKTIFPILERPVFRKLPEELESNVSRRFEDQDIPKGADFVAPQLVKRGWHKSTGDGGYLEFRRSIVTPKIMAIPYIEGPAAWYQQNTAPAKIHTITFIGKDWRDKLLIKDIPDSFYSEVMADMDFLIKTQ